MMIKKFLTRNQTTKKVIIILTLMFILSSFVRYIMSLKTATMSIFYDELLYWDISKSLFSDGATLFRNLLVANKDIIYPLMISRAHGLFDFTNVYYAILLINAITMSTVVFPTYGFANRILKNKTCALLISLFSILIPEIFYTTHLLQENLYYPLMMWVLYLFVVFLSSQKHQYLRVAVFTCFLCVLTYIKGIGLCLIVSLSIFFLWQAITNSEMNKKIKAFVNLFEVIIIYIVFKTANDAIISILFKQIDGDSVSEISGRALSRILDVEKWGGYITPCISYVFYIILLFGVFTVLIPIAYAKFFDKTELDLLAFCISIAVTTLAVVCLIIIDADNQYGNSVIRLHSRYFFYLIIPFLVLFIKLYDKLQEVRINKSYIVVALVYIMCALISFPEIQQGSTVDSITANSLQFFFMTVNRQYILKFIMILGIIIGGYLIYKGKVVVLYVVVFVCLGALFTHSTQKIYKQSYEEKVALMDMNEDGEKISDFFDSQQGQLGIDDILLVAWNKSNTGATEAHINVSYRVCQINDFLDERIWNDGNIRYALLDFYCMDSYRLDNYVSPRYIIVQGELSLNGYKLIDIDLKTYNIYERIE